MADDSQAAAEAATPETFISVQKLNQGFGHCKEKVDAATDGDVLGIWLLTLIDHWDHDFERIAVLTANSLLVIKYDFLSMAVTRVTRISFYTVFKIVTGEFSYPAKSVVPQSSRREGNGARIYFKKGEASALQKFNPWTKEMPYVTFTTHVAARSSSGSNIRHDDPRLQVNPFYGRMVEAVRSCRSRLATDRRMAGVDDEDAYQVPTESLEVVEEPIVLEVYLGWSAALHNTSQLGFLKNRGFINF